MNSKTEKLVKRSIKEEQIYWQYNLLNDKYTTGRFGEFKDSFKEPKPDFKQLYQQLHRVWLEEEIKSNSGMVINSSVVLKYNLRLNKSFEKQVRMEIESDIDSKLVENILNAVDVIQRNSEEKHKKEISGFIDELKTIDKLLMTATGDSERWIKQGSIAKGDLKFEVQEEVLPAGGKKKGKKKKKDRKKVKKMIREILLNPVPKNRLQLERIPFVLELVLFAALTKCHPFQQATSAFFTTDFNPIFFLSLWFNNFFLFHKKFIKSNFDIFLMSHKQVRNLRKAIAEEKKKFDKQRVSVFDMAWEGKNSEVKKLLQKGMDVDARNELHRHTGLMHIAAEKNNIELIKILIENFGADVNIRDRLMKTPLFYAVEAGSKEVVRLLISYGGDLDAEDRNQSPLMYWALNISDLEMVQILYNAGADIDRVCSGGRRPLFKVAYLDKPDILRWLLSIERAKQDLNLTDHKGRGALHAACIGKGAGGQGKQIGGRSIEDSSECLEILLGEGCDVNFLAKFFRLKFGMNLGTRLLMLVCLQMG